MILDKIPQILDIHLYPRKPKDEAKILSENTFHYMFKLYLFISNITNYIFITITNNVDRYKKHVGKTYLCSLDNVNFCLIYVYMLELPTPMTKTSGNKIRITLQITNAFSFGFVAMLL